MYAYLLVIMTNTLPERTHPQLAELSTFWADRWNPESMHRLADAVGSLVRTRRLLLETTASPATEWESQLLTMVELPNVGTSRELYPGTFSVESLQVTAGDESGSALAREFGRSTPPELVQAFVTEALGDVEELDVAIGRFVGSSLASFGPDIRHESAELLASRVKGQRYTVSEAMASAMLSVDKSRDQLLINYAVATAFQRSVAASELGLRKYAQCFLNGWDDLEVSTGP